MKHINFETQAIKTQTPNQQNREHSSPIYMTSSFIFSNGEEARATFAEEIEGNIYSRYSNPNTTELIEKMCALEKTEAGLTTSSGMSAIFASTAGLLSQTDHIISSKSIFGSTHQLFTKILPKWGIEHDYFDINNPQEIKKLIKPNTKMLFAETPSNPGLDILDLNFLREISTQHHLILNVDNCFTTPYLQRPAEFGADLVTHSSTKWIDGQGRALGGLILGNIDLIEKIRFFTRHTGPSLSPFSAWIFSKSLETLGVRMERHCQNAQQLAIHLQHHDQLSLVKYPFLASHPQYQLAKKQMNYGGGLITITLKNGFSSALKFLDNLNLINITANLGDTRTIATHPASTTHSKLSEEERKAVGITPGLVRISVGLEHIQDIIEDIEQALAKA